MCFPLSSISNYILEPNSLKLMNFSPFFMIHCCYCLATDYITYILYLLPYEKRCYSLKQFHRVDKVLSILCRWIALPFPLSLSDWPIPRGLQQFNNQDNNQCLSHSLNIPDKRTNLILSCSTMQNGTTYLTVSGAIQIKVILDEQGLFHSIHQGCEATPISEH